MSWSLDELATIATTDDLHVSPFREDGVTYGTPTWIWSVVVDGQLYARAYNGARSRWYQAAVRQGAGRIMAAGRTREVLFETVEGDIHPVVASERSFTRAATRLGVSRSAVSDAIQDLEERLGLRLLARTTRAVAVTEAGQRLLERLAPALRDIEAALSDLGHLRRTPAGVIRLIAPPIVLSTLLSPKLASFTQTYPEIALDITSEDDARGDLVAGRFDAGIHLGEFLHRDMTAVRVTGQQRAAVVAAPSYFATHPRPKTPKDLTAHRCLQYRMGTDGPVYRWEFEKRGKAVTVATSGPSP